MSREKQIDEIRNIIETDCDFICDKCEFVGKEHCFIHYCSNAIYEAGYRKQSEVELRVETITDDFKDLEVAKERGYHRKKFYCLNCDLLIKIETWDSERMFGSGTILKSNEMPKFCPECGAKLKGGAE